MGAREYGVRARGYGVGSEDIVWEPEDMVTLVILMSSQSQLDLGLHWV